jgi:hypothetical protein
MARRSGLAFLVASALLWLPAAASAQAWDVPSFLGPQPVDEIGAAFINPEHSDWGLVGFWRQTGGLGLGVRAGFVDLGNVSSILVGADFFGQLLTPRAGSPLALAWTAGAGGTFMEDVTTVRIPLGLSGGLSLALGSGLTIQPYVHPRLGLDLLIVDDETETDTSVSVDVGADIGLGQSVRLRVAGSFVDTPAWGIGLSWLGGRGVAAR